MNGIMKQAEYANVGGAGQCTKACSSVLCCMPLRAGLRSKAAHRVSTLLQEHFGMSDLTEDSPRLFASLLPPDDKKAEALR